LQLSLNDRPIAVFDSGLGGLTVAAEIHRQLPNENLIFLADRARVPYASLSHALIARFAGECFDFLLALRPKAVVIACNTVSAVALDQLVRRSPVPVSGVIDPTARAAARATKTRRIGVIATVATVKRQAYDHALSELVQGVQVHSNGCPLLVPLVEEGWTEGEIPRRIVEHYLEPIKPADVDTLVLGCTHYEYFRETIQRTLGGHVTLINTPRVTAEQVAERLAERHLMNDSREPSRVAVYSTDISDALHRVVKDLFASSQDQGRVSIHAAQIPPQPNS
jgi:glutamate racemase